MATAIDPVCKMEVDTENPPGGQSEHQGTDHYFCAPGCKVAFDKEPGKYLGEAASEDAHENHGHGHGHGGPGHDHGHGHDHGPAIKFPERRPGFFSRLFGRK